MSPVQQCQKIASGNVVASTHTGWEFEVANGPGRVEGRPLKNRRQKTRAPVAGARLGDAAWIGDGDERGQVLVLAAERVVHPGPHARETVEGETGRHEV